MNYLKCVHITFTLMLPVYKTRVIAQKCIQDLVGKPEWNRSIRRPRRTRGIILKWILQQRQGVKM